ncbi:CGNR zinc finger domain-containing protein [Streptomyces sp. NPDC057424]|uniref:CGNR zinc finger domain-containing protein n=1 Tax=Streptomyces sp. NPDC057424 TaxID=3346127 RepID=UPI0036A76E18
MATPADAARHTGRGSVAADPARRADRGAAADDAPRHAGPGGGPGDPSHGGDREDFPADPARRGDREASPGGPAARPAVGDGGGAGFTADAAQLTAVRELRAAVRALFARVVRPGEPSPADAARLMPLPEAVRCLNEAAARTPTVPVLHWYESATPVVHQRPVRGGDDLTAALAHAVIAFLASPDRDRLRACHAPRCVRYFLKEHPRQEWCKPSCGNRARVARHHQRHKAWA